MNPRKLQQMMEQMGIEMSEIDAVEVRVETADGEVLVFDAPEVTRMDAQGQRTYQIVGEPETIDADDDSAPALDIPDEDVDIVVARTDANPADARAALEATDGDLAAAIDHLS